MTEAAGSEQTRIKAKIEQTIPDEAIRRGVLEILAYAVENADDERADSWLVREWSNGLALFAGRLLVLRFNRTKLQVSVMGPMSDELKALGTESEPSDEWRAVPGGIFVTLPLEKATAALPLLKTPLDAFVDAAMARVRRVVDLDQHRPEAVAYVAEVVGRSLPVPSVVPVTDDDEDDGDPDDGLANREAKIRGRGPIFDSGNRSIAALVEEIDQKTMALPDLQRPFVWEDTKVRDLLDSLFVGFPVGTLVLWHTAEGKEARAVGGPDALKATTLVIDGQQRLTALYAVVRGAEVTERDLTRRRITIAFRPRDGRFEVADAAIRNDPEFLPSVTALWDGKKMVGQIRRELLKTLRDHGREISDAYETAVEENLGRAQAITEYRFPVVIIQKTASAEEAKEEDVAEIFVRINNQGKRLGQADFVLTLLSVFHGPLRDRIEECALSMSRESVIDIDTQQLLRVTCAVGFSRARMSAVYRYLRGVDPVSGDTSVVNREQRLKTLDEAAGECINPTTWRDFMLRVVHAGVVSQALVASNNAITNAYALYVLGRRVGVEKARLEELMSRWLFGTMLSARYSASSETMFEKDLARVAGCKPGDADKFVLALDGALEEVLTGDYWTHSVVNALETQRGRAPTALAFRAAQIVLKGHALFSDQPLQNLLAPPGKGKRSASEVHHLFPKAWLAGRGIKDRKRVNQVANLADVGWHENNSISSESPLTYVPRLREQLKLTDEKWARQCAEHALPVGWEKLEYEAFLPERRRRMAELTRVAFRRLGGEGDATLVSPPWFLPDAEQVWRRIVETERSLRGVVREVYGSQFGAGAAKRIEDALQAHEREALQRALRARPVNAEPLSVVDYLYLGQLPTLLFVAEVWQHARLKFGAAQDSKQRLQLAIQQIAPVRNEIAHVREVELARLQKSERRVQRHSWDDYSGGYGVTTQHDWSIQEI